MGFNKDQGPYQSLRRIVAERTRPLIVWVGSGLSAEAGLPTWPELKAHLVEAASRKAATLAPNDAKSMANQIGDIRSSRDYWVSFERLKKILGAATYAAEVRDALAIAERADIPRSYDLVWRLPINGMFTLNIDRLAARSFPATATTSLLELSGDQVGRLRSLLFGPNQFVANIHGVLHDEQTWVFTNTELRRLQASEAYVDAMRLCLSACVNIFVGMSVDDRAIGGHLDALTSQGVSGAPCFWITHRDDLATDSWAEARGLRVIRYRAADGDHSEFRELLEDLSSYVSTDSDDAPPVLELPAYTLDQNSSQGLLRSLEEDVSALTTDELRERLNAIAASLLRDASPTAYACYSEFVDEYDELIYRAWYTSAKRGQNRLLGYTLEEEVARGAFGRVYRATTAAGEQVAVKVLLDEVRREPSLLASFRRGVRSMSILRESDLGGMVRYIAASEIPAFVVMEWVEGPDLSVAREAGAFEDWASILEVAAQVCQIIRAAHGLPQRVLHRDLRPSNIMLRDYWTDPMVLDVVVLDFDLSWHRGAAEKSVVFTTATGYLAPEQQVARPRESTRSSAVDSFGFGMTLYHLLAGSDPSPNVHATEGWDKKVKDAAVSPKGGERWSSVSYRFARLIVGLTLDRQADRWSLARAQSEIDRLKNALLDGVSDDAGFVAEELMARSPSLARYIWHDEDMQAECRLASGAKVVCRADLVANSVELRVSWSRTGVEQRTGLAKYVRERVAAVESRLKPYWSLRRMVDESDAFEIVASRPALELARVLPAAAQALEEAAGKLAFER